jgi:hypothetical protein
MVKHLPSKHKALNSIPILPKIWSNAKISGVQQWLILYLLLSFSLIRIDSKPTIPFKINLPANKNLSKVLMIFISASFSLLKSETISSSDKHILKIF